MEVSASDTPMGYTWKGQRDAVRTGPGSGVFPVSSWTAKESSPRASITTPLIVLPPAVRTRFQTHYLLVELELDVVVLRAGLVGRQRVGERRWEPKLHASRPVCPPRHLDLATGVGAAAASFLLVEGGA
jgi:hypothetical protein